MVMLMVTRVGAALGPSEATDSLVNELLNGHAEREAGELRLALAVWTRWAWAPTGIPRRS